MIERILKTCWVMTCVQIVSIFIMEYSIEGTQIKEANSYLLLLWGFCYMMITNLIGFYIALIVVPIIDKILNINQGNSK